MAEQREIRTCACGNRFLALVKSKRAKCDVCTYMKKMGMHQMVLHVPEYRTLWNGRGEHAQYCPLG